MVLKRQSNRRMASVRNCSIVASSENIGAICRHDSVHGYAVAEPSANQCIVVLRHFVRGQIWIDRKVQGQLVCVESDWLRKALLSPGIPNGLERAVVHMDHHRLLGLGGDANNADDGPEIHHLGNAYFDWAHACPPVVDGWQSGFVLVRAAANELGRNEG